MRQALITGGARGIGWGIANAMLEAGYAVTVTGLTPDEIKAVPAREHLKAVQLDVTSDAQVASLLAGFDSLDVLVNCAGIIMRGAEYEIETFKKVVDVNLTGTMRMCVAAKPLLAKSANAAIVNTASMLSFFGGTLGPRLCGLQGRHFATHQIAGHCLGRRRHSRQCHSTRLDQHRTDPRPHQRRGALGGNPCPHPHEALGRACRYRRQHRLPLLRRRPFCNRNCAAHRWRLRCNVKDTDHGQNARKPFEQS